MSKTLTALGLKFFLAVAVLVAGCTQLPTEKQTVSDMRPQISFKVQGDAALVARVLVDGLDLGSVGEFVDGIAALRVLPGVHKVLVTTGTTVLLDEKVYLGDGVSRSFIVK